jgi:hypothetical protein
MLYGLVDWLTSRAFGLRCFAADEKALRKKTTKATLMTTKAVFTSVPATCAG